MTSDLIGREAAVQHICDKLRNEINYSPIVEQCVKVLRLERHASISDVLCECIRILAKQNAELQTEKLRAMQIESPKPFVSIPLSAAVQMIREMRNGTVPIDRLVMVPGDDLPEPDCVLPSQGDGEEGAWFAKMIAYGAVATKNYLDEEAEKDLAKLVAFWKEPNCNFADFKLADQRVSAWIQYRAISDELRARMTAKLQEIEANVFGPNGKFFGRS